jgi:type III pantothenate kinase
VAARRSSFRLAVDIGNTEVAIGVYAGRGPGSSRGARRVRARSGSRSKPRKNDFSAAASGLERVLRFSTEPGITSDGLFALLHPHLSGLRFETVIVSSVVPHLVPAWTDLATRHFRCRPLVLEPGMIPGIRIDITRPEEAGVDRVVNAWMGFRRYGGPLVVVDMGTATTLDVVDASGAYRGGVIAPGVNLFADSLSRRTARLPRIGLEPPPRAIGRSTVEALRSGIVLGHTSMVDGLLERVCGELGERRAVATGGLMNSIRPMLDNRFLAFDATLTLDGIAAIAEGMR